VLRFPLFQEVQGPRIAYGLLSHGIATSCEQYMVATNVATWKSLVSLSVRQRFAKMRSRRGSGFCGASSVGGFRASGGSGAGARVDIKWMSLLATPASSGDCPHFSRSMASDFDEAHLGDLPEDAC